MTLRRDVFGTVADPQNNLLLNMRRVLISFLRSYFSHEPMAGLQWIDDQQRTQIFIADALPENVEDEDMRPAIITERSTVQRTRVGLNDDVQAADFVEDKTKHLWLCSVHMNFHCISRAAVQSEEIAWVVHTLIHTYADQIATKMPLQGIGSSTIAHTVSHDPSLPQSDWFDTTVTIEMHMHHSFEIHRVGYTRLQGTPTQNL